MKQKPQMVFIESNKTKLMEGQSPTLWSQYAKLNLAHVIYRMFLDCSLQVKYFVGQFHV